MDRPRDIEAVVNRTFELLGGPERARETVDAEFGEMVRRWNQDVDAIGRILRAHLYVEHYLTECIRESNPHLGSLAEARLSFNQKLALLDTSTPALAELKPGITRLNKIRNRLAHRLSSAIEPDDIQVFLSARMFASMRSVALGHSPSTLRPLELLEQFALHAAHVLSGDRGGFSRAFAQALQEDKDRSDA